MSGHAVRPDPELKILFAGPYAPDDAPAAWHFTDLMRNIRRCRESETSVQHSLNPYPTQPQEV